MDPTRSAQILSDVRHRTGEMLDTASEAYDSDRSFDRALAAILVKCLVRHHDALWPSSLSTEDPERLEFGGAVFQVVVRDDLWDPSILELAYVPDGDDLRVESKFGIEFPLRSPDRHSTVRLFPPRLAYPFEFHQDAVISMVGCVFAAGWAWQYQRQTGG
jgi:hypothetical protein